MLLALRKKEPEPTSIPEWLISDDTAQIRHAENALKSMDPASATRHLVWLAALEEEKRWRRIQRIRIPLAYCTLIPAALWLCAVAMTIVRHTELPPPYIVPGIIVLMNMLVRLPEKPSRLESVILERLCGESDDPVILPLLADAIRQAPRATMDIVVSGLIRLLPHITPETAMSPDQWRKLLAYACSSPRTAAETNRKQRLTEAILEALRRTECVELLPEVTRLTSRPPSHLKTPPIVDAAYQCLTFLKQRSKQSA